MGSDTRGRIFPTEPINSYPHRRATESRSGDSKSDSQAAAENYLANLSTEVELDGLTESEQEYDFQQEDANDSDGHNTTESDGHNTTESDGHNTTESDDEGKLGTELRRPDFILFCISAALRRVILIVEVKPGPQVTDTSSEKVSRQAKIQAGFAFDIWPQESIVYSLMLVGRMFRLKKFIRTEVPLPQHKVGRSDMESYKPTENFLADNEENVLGEWRNVFDEELVTHQSGGQTITTFLEMRRFSQEFKGAINEVMNHHGLGSVQWGNC